MIDFIIAVIIGIAWGWWAREQAAKKRVERMIEQADEILEEENEINDTIIARVEKHGDNFYLFSEQSDEFIVQGKDMQEIRENLNKRYLGKKNLAIRKDENSKGLL